MDRVVRQTRRVFQTIAAALAMIGGFILLPQSIHDYRSARAISAWPTANGTVIASHSSPVPSGDFHSAQVAFQYEVDGVAHTNELWNFGNKAACDSIVDQYPINATVSVFYNPNFPETSVLDPDTLVDFHDYMFWGVNIFLILGGVLGIAHAGVALLRKCPTNAT